MEWFMYEGGAIRVSNIANVEIIRSHKTGSTLCYRITLAGVHVGDGPHGYPYQFDIPPNAGAELLSRIAES